MRLVVCLFGREVLSISTDPPESETYEHDHLAAQVEHAGEQRLGFQVHRIPSLEES